MMADVSLDLVRSSERILDEESFAEAELFVRSLTKLRPQTSVCCDNAHDAVSSILLRRVEALNAEPSASRAKRHKLTEQLKVSA